MPTQIELEIRYATKLNDLRDELTVLKGQYEPALAQGLEAFALGHRRLVGAETEEQLIERFEAAYIAGCKPLVKRALEYDKGNILTSEIINADNFFEVLKLREPHMQGIRIEFGEGARFYGHIASACHEVSDEFDAPSFSQFVATAAEKVIKVADPINNQERREFTTFLINSAAGTVTERHHIELMQRLITNYVPSVSEFYEHPKRKPRTVLF